MKSLLLSLLLCFCMGYARAQPIVGFLPILNNVSELVDGVGSNDGSNRIFLIQKSGIVRIYQNNQLKPNAFLNMSSLVLNSGEQGLLSLAFHPQYATNRYFFVYYSALNGNITIARYRTSLTNPDSAAAGGTVLLSINKSNTNHNGGRLQFGSDGFLYFGTGDGGGSGDVQNNAQNGNSLLGKMLRIDVNGFATAAPFYSIPSTNPFITNANIRDEIIGLGLRNPFRWSLDRRNGNMWIGDVGQNAREEVNMATPAQYNAGLNFGWRCFEGDIAFNTNNCVAQSSYFSPVFVYNRSMDTGGVSITGGEVARREGSGLNGYYVVTDFSSRNTWLLSPNGSGGFAAARQGNSPQQITSYFQSEDSMFYCTTLSGTLYSVTGAVPLPVRLAAFGAALVNGKVNVTARLLNAESGDRIIVEEIGSQTTRELTTRVMATNQQQYDFQQFFAHDAGQELGYRLRIESGNGMRTIYSQIVYLKPDAGNVMQALLVGRQIRVTGVSAGAEFTLTNTAGQVLHRARVLGGSGSAIDIPAGLKTQVLMINLVDADGRRFSKTVLLP